VIAAFSSSIRNAIENALQVMVFAFAASERLSLSQDLIRDAIAENAADLFS
jgi:hypothetical protein